MQIIATPKKMKIVNLYQLGEIINQMLLGFVICMAMFWNGAMIGEIGMKIILMKIL
jgi:hypothetical protein